MVRVSPYCKSIWLTVAGLNPALLMVKRVAAHGQRRYFEEPF